jgi:salicylate hydroxylase
MHEFRDWCPAVRAVIAATPPERCFQWALHVREPLQEWVRAPAVLLGDAAHPMTPFLGIGAGIAIEDAMVLARAVGASADVTEALQPYQAARVAHANRAQRESAAQGLALLDPVQASGHREIYGENALGLYQYDATGVAI